MQIDKGIPLPQARNRAGVGSHRSMYPFREMEVGDSIFYPGEWRTIHECKPYLAAVTVTKRDRNLKFAGRKVVENGTRGVRIWRVD